MFPLKLEAVILTVIAVCIFLTFYFTLLSFQTIDDAIKKQFVTIALYSLIAGIVIFASLMIHFSIKKIISPAEEQLIESEDSAQFDRE